ncbi:hypothetical protein T02_6098 [Trichinella nativa]|uniref:Uncharacterized protein n=1 Tax=Trichinella nativa TaxID=6335 RepID=A0A0V1LSZ9_9BILA|nr:hypothetical protein T02_6098 [Trichinella nativa]
MQIIAQNNNCCYVVLPDTMKYLDRNQSSISQRIKIIDYVDALSNYNKFLEILDVNLTNWFLVNAVSSTIIIALNLVSRLKAVMMGR